MELFPAQPDLSLQITPPNSKSTSSNWKRSTEEEMDLGFWKRALESKTTTSLVKTNTSLVKTDLSLSNPRPSSSNTNIPNTNTNLIHHFQNNINNNNGNNPIQQNHFFQQDLGFLRPIRGIPVYQNPSLSFPHPHAPSNTPTPSNPFLSQPLINSRFLSRFPPKRHMRAPRMRWTTTLHARFVHVVQLLGGHESNHAFIISLLHFLFFFSPLYLQLCFSLCFYSGNRQKKETNGSSFLLKIAFFFFLIDHRGYTQISS